MKWLFNVAILIISLVFITCSSEDVNIPSTTEKSTGLISLKIDRVNAPANVEEVVAYLTREGFEPIIKSLNLLSDSTADITFEAIAVGVWHLKVDALNGDGEIVYTGETDVEVLDGVLVQVSLTLQPTGNGTGTIYLYVTWGSGSFGWVDYIGNPILVKTGSNFDFSGITQTFTLQDDGEYKMYYTGYASGSMTYTFLATSSDGITWTKYSTVPVLYPGGYGTWDQGRASAGPVIKEDGVYKMYYHSFNDVYNNWHIGLATSTDGINWTKYPYPVLSGGNWDYRLAANEVFKIGSTYYMIYTGYNQDFYQRIGLATSTDGIVWTKYTGSPILYPTKTWEETGIGYPSIILENGTYKMVYQNTSPSNTGFGFAYSTDLINWTKDETNPFFTDDDTITPWNKIVFPDFNKFDNEYRIYYGGGEALGYDNFKICMVRKFLF